MSQPLVRIVGMKAITTDETLQLVWGKYDDINNEFHPLICHLLDVAAVAEALLERYTPDELISLGEKLGFEDRSEWKPFSLFLIALHDIGKATPNFQMKAKKHKPKFENSNLCLPSAEYTGKHTRLGQKILSDLLHENFDLDRDTARYFTLSVMGHHGTYPPLAESRLLTEPGNCPEAWKALRQEIFDQVKQLINVENLPTTPLSASGLIFISGLCTISDWIGSSEEFFPYAHPENLQTYYDKSKERARNALDQLHLSLPSKNDKTFRQLFPGFSALNPLQQTSKEIVDQAQSPFVMVIEAPMGEGKTEAALLAYAQWHRHHDLRGFYFALPTQATGNMLFRRVESFLRNYSDTPTQFHLLHGAARFNDDYRKLRLRSVWNDDHTGSIYADAWFTPKKRALLAQYGVGTIDQALIGVLQSRHFFLRLYELAGKVLIIDEVHAYDTYMSTLLEDLLGWLRQLGTSVILLSATLPSRKREALLQAYLGNDSKTDLQSMKISYPNVALCDSKGYTRSIPLESTRRSTVTFQPICFDDSYREEVASLLKERLMEGGCAACILNTVDEAQRLYQHLKTAFPDTEIHLFHARFTLRQRLEIENKIIERFGKNGRRPHKAIVIATQVLEQSLDVDFDLMISALAPIDLLLQRAGRLHRHERPRPEPLQKRNFYLLLPSKLSNTKDQFGNSRFVYFPSVLYRSAKLFQNDHGWEKRDIQIPDDLPKLIETVYGDTLETSAVRQWIEEEEGQEYAELFFAHQSSIGQNVDDDEEILLDIADLVSDDPDTANPSTRLGPKTKTVIVTDSNDDLTLKHPRSVESCYYKSLRIQHQGLIRYLEEHTATPEEWKKESLLYDAFPFDPNMHIEEKSFVAYYCDELGMVIRKKEGK